MVTQFPIAYMHLVLLGVVRKFTKYWAQGPYSVRHPAKLLGATNVPTALVRPYTPCDFSRKLRDLNNRERWKATESRQFLLYAYLVVLKEILRTFPALHDTTCCHQSPVHKRMSTTPPPMNSCNTLLHMLVQIHLLGKLCVYNMHALIHLVDIRTFGLLDSFSRFQFQNYLGEMSSQGTSLLP